MERLLILFRLITQIDPNTVCSTKDSTHYSHLGYALVNIGLVNANGVSPQYHAVR
jgi:hypothetical protein